MSSPRLTFRDLSSSSSKKRKASENTPSKRQRFKSLFAEEIIDVDLPKKIDAVRQCFSQLGGNCVSDNDLLSSLVISYGFKSVTRFLGALNHVPDSFVDRNLYVSRIVNVESVVIPFDQISKYSERLKGFVKENKIELAADILWKCTDSYGEGYLAFLVPPVMQCLECGEQLYTCNKVGITLFTLKGPLPGLKVTKRCKKGCGALYNIDRYSVPGAGTTFYKNYKTCIAASNCVYVEKDVHELLCQSANHGFVSHHAFSEIYNAVFQDGLHSSRFKHWVQSSSKDVYEDDTDISEDVIHALTEDHLENMNDEPQPKFILTRKKAINCYLNGELINEIQERKDDTLKIRPGESREAVLRRVDEIRRTEVYEHKKCNQSCKDKGCETLRVIDSCWKVCMPHCMFAVEMEVEGMPLINFPNVCTSEPKPKSVFCERHHELLESNGIPTKKEDYLRHIGCKERPFSPADIDSVDQGTVKLSRELRKNGSLDSEDTSAGNYQGTSDVVSKIDPTKWDTAVICNKDTGQKSRLRQRSRGHFICVTGGGHIQYFEPIFKSESPGQIFLIVLRVMMLELSNIPDDRLEETIEKFVLSYDNMCQLDALKASKEPLPFPAPYDLMWQKITKIIDRLHITNHKDEKCKTLYSPNQIPSEHNTMIAEQTFSWFSRFKKVVNSMNQAHHLFYIHRNIKRRNEYTERCRINGRSPLLPGINTKTAYKRK